MSPSFPPTPADSEISQSRRAYCTALALAALGGNAMAQTNGYPNRPTRFIVGPGPDLLARIVADKLSSEWGQAVIVDQRPGAGGIVAAEAVAKSPADGYMLLLSTGSYTINATLQPHAPYDFVKDLAPVTLIATLPFVLVVSNDFPAHTFKDLVAMAKAQPGKLNFASAGNGTPPHLAGEMLKQMAHLNIVHVPYKGAAPAVNDVMGGMVQMMFVPAPTALSLVKGGKLRALAVSGTKRYFALPDVPTVAEAGYPDFAVVGWNGVHVAAKTPQPIIDRLAKDIAAIMKTPEAREKAQAVGFEPVSSTRADFAAFVKTDLERSAKVIREGHITID